MLRTALILPGRIFRYDNSYFLSTNNLVSKDDW